MSFRSTIKKIPYSVALVRKARRAYASSADWLLRRTSKNYCGEVFQKIFTTGKWLGAGDSVSGVGSTLAATVGIRRELPNLVNRLGIRSLVDAPCGDFMWMSEIVGCFESYTGIDVVPELVARNQAKFARPGVRFLLGDITAGDLPAADAVLCRDCFIHLSTPLVWAALPNFRRAGYRYLLLTHDQPVSENREIVTGGWRAINWHLPPFCFPAPIDSIAESTGEDRLIAVWKTERLAL
jgi:hypothetical protein